MISHELKGLQYHFPCTFLNQIFLDTCRYNFEEIFINCCHNLHRDSISCAVWSHSDYKLYLRNLYCFHLYAPGKLERGRNYILSVSWTWFMYYFSVQFFSPLAKIKDEPQNGNLELMDNENNRRCVLVHFGYVYKLYLN